MKSYIAVALIVVGGLLILGPVLAHAHASGRDKELIAEFFARQGNGAPLPEAMLPTGYAVYEWACLVAGVGMVITGIRGSMSTPMTNHS
jgi:hypothetical protein